MYEVVPCECDIFYGGDASGEDAEPKLEAERGKHDEQEIGEGGHGDEGIHGLQSLREQEDDYRRYGRFEAYVHIPQGQRSTPVALDKPAQHMAQPQFIEHQSSNQPQHGVFGLRLSQRCEKLRGIQSRQQEKREPDDRRHTGKHGGAQAFAPQGLAHELGIKQSGTRDRVHSIASLVLTMRPCAHRRCASLKPRRPQSHPDTVALSARFADRSR
jgi:hypothetical protein